MGGSFAFIAVSQLVKDLDLKAFHNRYLQVSTTTAGVTARQRS